MYMHIVYIQYTLCEVLNEVPTYEGKSTSRVAWYSIVLIALSLFWRTRNCKFSLQASQGIL